MNYEIADLEISNVIPAEERIPRTIFTTATLYKHMYSPSFRVQSKEEADAYLLMLVGYHLRFGTKAERDEQGNLIEWRNFTWREAFQESREWLATMALAHDVEPLYRLERGEKVENCHWRKIAWELYGARLPEGMRSADMPSIRVEAENDLIAKAHLRGEKKANAQGVVYWTKIQKFDKQEQLFK